MNEQTHISSAAEILKEVKPFIEEGVGVHVIIKGLRMARDLAITRIKEIAVTVDKSDPQYVSPPAA
jgi:T-complex protein 1 subunit eta